MHIILTDEAMMMKSWQLAVTSGVKKKIKVKINIIEG
jgi:hypothetical protein